MNENFDITYKALFRRYYPSLIFYATRLVGEEEAEDVVQDVFVELWKRKDHIEIGDQIQAFLYRAVYTRALKKEKKMSNLSEEIINRYLTGQCSEEELIEVNAWMKESEENARQLFRMEEIYHLGKFDQYTDEQRILRAEKQLYKKLDEEKGKQSKILSMHRWMKYAAVIAAKNRHKPFTVQSDAIRVRVLGTTFNLKSDKRCRIAEATLIEGEIEVKGNKEEGQIILTPGQRAELNKNNGRLTVKQVDAKLDAVWHDNLIPFQKADIFTITKALERFYDVKIILSPDIQTGKTYSGVLKRKSNIESVLKSLQNSIPIDYKIVGNNIFISPK